MNYHVLPVFEKVALKRELCATPVVRKYAVEMREGIGRKWRRLEARHNSPEEAKRAVAFLGGGK